MRCGVKPFQYPTLIKWLLEPKMVKLLNSHNVMIGNSIFGDLKNMGIIEPLIWAGSRPKLLFHEEASVVELPTSDLVSSIFLFESDQLFHAGC